MYVYVYVRLEYLTGGAHHCGLQHSMMQSKILGMHSKKMLSNQLFMHLLIASSPKGSCCKPVLHTSRRFMLVSTMRPRVMLIGPALQQPQQKRVLMHHCCK